MKLTPLIFKAINRAAFLHQNQKRKVPNYLPYISHCFAVAWILSDYTDDEEVIAAGILHDVLEDVPAYGPERLKQEFGERVAGIVKEDSDDKDPNNPVEPEGAAAWTDRKKRYLANLKTVSQAALLVCAADKMHNLQSILDAYKEEGDAIWKNFNAPREKVLWPYEEVLKIAKDKLQSPIISELEKVYRLAEKEFGYGGR
ncbi:MAG: HD domain-containing protein [Candidatus Pacebacteria bacterium]|nr:HD domain-containing protein [Candidatus Paceibacterota bacterium]